MRSTCAAAPNVRSSPLGADTVCKSRNNFAVDAVSLLTSFRLLVFVLLGGIFLGVISLLSELLAAGMRFLYGGEDDEAIRFMEPKPAVQKPVQESVQE